MSGRSVGKEQKELEDPISAQHLLRLETTRRGKKVDKANMEEEKIDVVINVIILR